MEMVIEMSFFATMKHGAKEIKEKSRRHDKRGSKKNTASPGSTFSDGLHWKIGAKKGRNSARKRSPAFAEIRTKRREWPYHTTPFEGVSSRFTKKREDFRAKEGKKIGEKRKVDRQFARNSGTLYLNGRKELRPGKGRAIKGGGAIADKTRQGTISGPLGRSCPGKNTERTIRANSP